MTASLPAQNLPQPDADDMPADPADLRSAVDAHERAMIEGALVRHRFNQRQTAKSLGLSYDQLRHAMKKHRLVERG